MVKGQQKTAVETSFRVFSITVTKKRLIDCIDSACMPSHSRVSQGLSLNPYEICDAEFMNMLIHEYDPPNS
jgi:hypothetical protein